jgi:hypothetical protein
MQLSLVSAVTGLQPVVLGLYFHFIQAGILIATGCYVFLRHYITDKIFIVSLMIVLALSTGIERVSAVFRAEHLVTVTNGSDYAFAFFMDLIFLLKILV